jgi:hypothetical protein
MQRVSDWGYGLISQLDDKVWKGKSFWIYFHCHSAAFCCHSAKFLLVILDVFYSVYSGCQFINPG